MNIVLLSAPGAGKGVHRLRSSLQSIDLLHILSHLTFFVLLKLSLSLALKARVYGCWSACSRSACHWPESAFLQTMQRLVLFLTGTHTSTFRQ